MRFKRLIILSGLALLVPFHSAFGKSKSALKARFETTAGDFVVRLFSDEAPKTVKNFVGLAEGTKEFAVLQPEELQRVLRGLSKIPKEKWEKRPFYDGLIFHRVIPNFMIQGGDPLGSGMGGPGYRFDDEFQSDRGFDKPGILAMANSGPNTNGSQFFITVAPTPWLNKKHTIFGEVIEGYDVVKKISEVPTSPGNNRPLEDVKIKKVTILRGK